MAAFRAAACLLFAVIFQGILGATLQENDKKIMRHERRDSDVRTLEMSSHAEFVETLFGSSLPMPGIEKSASGDDYCDYDYTFGKQNTNFCDNRSTTEMSDLKDNECIFASTKSGAQTPNFGFEIPQEWDDVHPKGCFTFPCGDKTGWCYFENEDGAIPHKNMTGYPVCRRWRYLNGHSVAGAAVDDPGMCPHSEYEVIPGHDDCQKAASCLGDCAGSEFRIGTHNASKHDEFPPGCFMHKNDTHDRSCVYWNDPEKGTRPGEKNHPTMPQGTPICRVKSSDHVSSLGPGGTGL
jgi:hypothetical protein